MRKYLYVLLVLGAIALVAFFCAGSALVVQDPIEHAPCAVVLGGKPPFRAMEAAALYKAGWVHQVWLTEAGLLDDDVALAQLGIVRTPEHVYNRRVLEKLGVPDHSIRLLTTRNKNTADEMQTVSRALQEAGYNRVILVTSIYHTRRVKIVWRAVGAKARAIVRYSPEESFDAAHWWRDAGYASAALHEWFGIFNAWLGFPVKSEHW